MPWPTLPARCRPPSPAEICRSGLLAVPSVGVQHPVDQCALERRLTRWLQHRVRETAPPSSAVQLFGLEVIDPDGIDALDPAAVRTIFVCDGRDERAAFEHPDSHRAFDFDAVAVVVRRGQKTAISSITMTTSTDAGRPSVSLPAPSKIWANGTCD